MQRLELAAQGNDQARAGKVLDDVPESSPPAPAQPIIGDSPMGGIVQEHCSRTTRAQAAAPQDLYAGSFAFATASEQPKAPTPSFLQEGMHPSGSSQALMPASEGVASPPTTLKAIPDMRHQAEAMAAALGLFQDPAGACPPSASAAAQLATRVVRNDKRASRKSLAGDLLPRHQPADKPAKPAGPSRAAGSSKQEDVQEGKQPAAAGRPPSREAPQKEGLLPQPKRSSRASVAFKEPMSEKTLGGGAGSAAATPGLMSRCFHPTSAGKLGTAST